MKTLTLIVILFALLFLVVWLLTITHSWILIAFECLMYVGASWLTVAVFIAPDVDD